jgi:ABC-2 type transport system permease protein
MFFVDIKLHNIPVIIVTLILTSTLFCLAGLINAIFAKSFDDISIIPTFVLTPLTYLGGVFYSLTLLPDFWQMVSKINPIVYMVSGFRYGFLGQSDFTVLTSISVLVIFNVVFAAVAWRLLSNGTGIRS